MSKKEKIRQARVDFWTKQINNLLDNPRYRWAKDNLSGIRKTIQDTERVTDKQIRAIKNIQNGKGSKR